MQWEPNTQEKFSLIISKIPIFHRHIAESAVKKKAEENAAVRKSSNVQEEDLVSAFFSDVPMPFYSMMVRILEETGIEYKKYGFPQSPKT